MHKIQSTLGRIPPLLVVFVLVVAAFWLVGRQAQPEPQPAAQPPPTTMSPPTETPTTRSTPSRIPEATVTPRPYGVHIGKGSFVTLEPPPSPTPTPTFEPLTGQAIDGYVFNPARPIPNTVGHSITFFDWLPDTPDKLLIIRDTTFLEVIDINTGETDLYNDGKMAVINPVWLPSRQSVAYLTVDDQDYTKQYLWISESLQGQATSARSVPTLTTSWLPPLTTTPAGNGVILFDANWQLTQVGALESQSVKLAAETQRYAPVGYSHGDLYQAVQAPDGRQAVYFNHDWLLLADFKHGDLNPIDLESLKTEEMPATLWVQQAAWSPNSDKLALVVRAGEMRQGNHLFVLDLQTNDLSFVRDDFQFVTALDWGPDDTQIIISVLIDLRDEGYGVNALFLVDIVSGEIKPISAVPDEAIGSTPNWSPDGKKIAVLYADKPRNPGLYIIDVQRP